MSDPQPADEAATASPETPADGIPAPPPSERPILAFFDVDNTLMHGASLFYVAREAVTQGIIRWRDIWRFFWHEFRFKRVGENADHLVSTRERALGLIKGHRKQEIEDLGVTLWSRQIKPRLYPGSVEVAHDHLAKGHEVWLVSATPIEVGSLIAERLGLTGALGTVVETDENGIYTGQLVGHVLHGEHKAVAARALALRAGADLNDCWAYSDSRNDLPLLELVGNPVVVNPDATLLHHAKQRGWPIMRLTPKSIREARRRVKREARQVRKKNR